MKSGRAAWKWVAVVLGLGSLMLACGNANGTRNSVGPTAILNGSALSSASSHWMSQNCAVQVELTSDGAFISAVTDQSGTTTNSEGTWAPSGSSGATATGQSVWVDSLTNIAGSTSAKSFSAGVSVDEGFQQSLGTCSFTLQSGVIPI